MFLKELSLVGFKNYDSLEVSFNSKLNCLVGLNAQGKTNILDAIYYLSFCKSYFNPVDRQNIGVNHDFFVCQGEFSKNEESFKVYCAVKKNVKKVFRKNKKDYEKLSDHIGEFPLVIIAPYDTNLILDGSEVRRKFIDGIRAQYDKKYLQTLIHYNKVLLQRNALLKYFSKERVFNADQLMIWDEQLIPLGEELFRKRKELIHNLQEVFQKNYNFISGGNEPVQLFYNSSLEKNSFKDLLTNNIQLDIQRQYTNFGVHKDDLDLYINNFPIKKFASQGQQKSYLIALKLAQLEFLKITVGVNPILLLDDVFDKLDEQRVKRLLSLLNTNDFGQIFLTDTDINRVKRVVMEVDMANSVFNVSNGNVFPIQF